MTTTPVNSGSPVTNFTVTSGNTLDVLNGGVAITTMVQANGLLMVEVGGVDSGATILAGGNETVLGSATGDQVFGTQLVSNATATVANETVFNGGAVDLFLAGVVGTNITVSSGGSLNISGRATASNTILSNATLSLQSPKATLSGSLTLVGANTILITASQSPGSAGLGDQAVVSGFIAGDVIDDTAVISGATVALTSAANGANTTVNITSGGTVVETFLFAGSVANLRLAADANGFTEIVACYCTGTNILTEAGEVAVETLAVGDCVVTADGRVEPIRWIGRRTYAHRALAGKRHLLPIRIKAGALAPSLPKRDLLISPMHAMLIDGLLIPAHALVNGASIVREEHATAVSYVHIELDQHDAILAEGTASETFIDDDSRFIFQQADGEPVSQPDDHARYFAPRVTDGYELEAIRLRIAGRIALVG